MVEHTTDVYLISGFLGAGKTTFLNRLIGEVPEEVTFLVLMNEFGEMGLDGTMVEGEDTDILEISKGSIFCACVKTDFIKALHEISQTVRPDVMLIETTGVANPHDLGRDLRLPIFNGAFLLRDKFCLIDAANFLDTYESFLAIEKQLAASDIFIINKTDLVGEETIGAIKKVVEGFNSEARFLEAVYADVPFSDLFEQGTLHGAVSGRSSGGVLESDAAERQGEAEVEAGVPGTGRSALTPEELDQYIDGLLSDQTAEVTPPDRLLSLVVESVPTNRRALKSWMDQLPRGVIRGKGILPMDEGLMLLSMVRGQWTLESYSGRISSEELLGRLVFVSRPEEIKEIMELSEGLHGRPEVSGQANDGGASSGEVAGRSKGTDEGWARALGGHRGRRWNAQHLSLIHISEPTRLRRISY